jgi:hypothetical protein
MLKLSKPVWFLLAATATAALYLVGSPAAPKRITTRVLSKPLVSVTSSQYTQQDFDANFPKPVLASRNAFQPLVVRKSSLAQALANAGNIPPEFAGGDPNWSCTGSAEVDGVRQALIENKNTNDGVFLKQGDRWKNCVVSQVLENAVVLVGPGGDAKTIFVKQDTPVDETDLSGTNPVQPELSGTIGNGGQQQGPGASPLPSPATISTADDNNAG